MPARERLCRLPGETMIRLAYDSVSTHRLAISLPYRSYAPSCIGMTPGKTLLNIFVHLSCTVTALCNLPCRQVSLGKVLTGSCNLVKGSHNYAPIRIMSASETCITIQG